MEKRHESGEGFGPAAARAALTRSFRFAPGLCFSAVCLYYVIGRLENVGTSDVVHALSMVSAGQIVAAAAFAGLSLLALACYDQPSLAVIGRSAPWTRALKGGFVGAVVAQSVGLGAVTGAYARHRIYRANGFSPAQSTALAFVVSIGFVIGAAILAAALTLLDPAPVAAILGSGETTVRMAAVGFFALAALALTSPRKSGGFRIRELTISLPGRRWLGAMTALTALDLAAAALCLAMLLPAGAYGDLGGFLLVFICATAIGHVVGTPGGVGPFEAVVFTALPASAAADLAAAIIVYRTIYYLIPLGCALTMIGLSPGPPKTPLLEGEALSDRIDWIADVAGRPEAAFARSGDKRVFAPVDQNAFVMFGVSGRIWLMMGDPIGPRREWDRLIDALRAEARAHGASLAIYKTEEDAAPFWRNCGFRLLPLGEEAHVDPTSFSLKGSRRRELRRKLRAAETARVSLRRHEPGEAPLPALASVAEAWRAAKNGIEHGFSMGAWSPGYLNRQRIVSAWIDDEPIAFISVAEAGDGSEWMLDLMRHNAGAANGAMHALVHDAIVWAQLHGAKRMNLCMAPLSGLEGAAGSGLRARSIRWIARYFGEREGVAGLRRFKAAFRPEWRPRNLAVRHWRDAPEALWAARRLVTGAAAVGAASIRSPLAPALPPPPAIDWPAADAHTSCAASAASAAAPPQAKSRAA